MGNNTKTESVVTYFEANVQRSDDPDGCWIWAGPKKPDGYGVMTYGASGGGYLPAYRFAYELYCDAIPDGLTIDHLCRNRLCVNPAHLEPVTRGENARRGHLTREEVETRRTTLGERTVDEQAEEPARQDLVPLERWHIEMPMAVDQNGAAYIPLRTLCAYLGISSDMQVRRIKEHPVIAKRLRRFMLKGAKGGRQATWCLSLHIIGFWLGSISVNHVRENLRQGLIDFQEDLVIAADAILQGQRQPQGTRIADVTRFTLALERRIGHLEDRVFGEEE